MLIEFVKSITNQNINASSELNKSIKRKVIK